MQLNTVFWYERNKQYIYHLVSLIEDRWLVDLSRQKILYTVVHFFLYFHTAVNTFQQDIYSVCSGVERDAVLLTFITIYVSVICVARVTIALNITFHPTSRRFVTVFSCIYETYLQIPRPYSEPHLYLLT